MNDARDQYLKNKKEREKQQYDEIINKPTLSPEELWLLTEKNFNEWRRKYDYPKLLNSFNNKLPQFVEWKKQYGLTDDMIMSDKISEFIGFKKLSKEKTMYFLEQTFDGDVRFLVAYANLAAQPVMFPEQGEAYKLIKEFVTYSDWCKEKKLEPGIFNITQRQAPRFQKEKVWLETGHELLKMGGIAPPVNDFGILLRGKHLEFVNLCGLKLEGEIHYGEEGNLDITYSAFDNVECTDLKMGHIDFVYCSINNLQIKSSEIMQWRFWECNTSGDIVNSKLSIFDILGGQFTPYIKNTHIIAVDATHKGHNHSNFHTTYSTLKKIYADQGDDKSASEYYIKERELSREFAKPLNYIGMSISYYYWRYGKKPANVIYYSIAVIVLCAFIYFGFQNYIRPVEETKSILDCFYFSTVTFTTLGYGDLLPIGGLRVVALLEAFFGALSIGFLVAGFSNNKY